MRHPPEQGAPQPAHHRLAAQQDRAGRVTRCDDRRRPVVEQGHGCRQRRHGRGQVCVEEADEPGFAGQDATPDCSALPRPRAADHLDRNARRQPGEGPAHARRVVRAAVVDDDDSRRPRLLREVLDSRCDRHRQPVRFVVGRHDDFEVDRCAADVAKLPGDSTGPEAGAGHEARGSGMRADTGTAVTIGPPRGAEGGAERGELVPGTAVGRQRSRMESDVMPDLLQFATDSRS